jgi:predicted GH43/DUF377 family glycosyl hydrolase
MNDISRAGLLHLGILVVWMLALASCAPTATPVPTHSPPEAASVTAPQPASATLPPAATTTSLPTETTAPPATIAIQSTTPANELLQFYAQNPVLPVGSDPNWDNVYIDPGATFFYQGQFHMFFNGINGFPRPVGVGYATSTDGYHWTRQVTQPVFGALNLDPKGEFHGQNLFVTSGLVLDDGTWVLYYFTMNGSTFTGPQNIGRATAPGPTGPWTPDPDPVLEPGPAGAWDDVQVSNPHVLKIQDGYRMYYDGMGSRSMIGTATSPDGIHWSKYDDPSTTDKPFIESDPVLVNDKGAWDAGRVMGPNVLPTDQGYLMLYLSTDGFIKFGNGLYAVGYATSPDGIHWTKGKENPVLSNQNHPDWRQTFLMSLVHQADTYYLYFDFVATGKSGTNVYLSTHKGVLGAR